jgi:hypothetical protein
MSPMCFGQFSESCRLLLVSIVGGLLVVAVVELIIVGRELSLVSVG